MSTPPGVSGQYFIRVQNKEYEADISHKIAGITYMISYTLIGVETKNPYEMVNTVNSEVTLVRDETQSGISLKLDVPKTRDPNFKVSEVKYLFLIGSSAENIKNAMFCSDNSKIHPLSYWVSVDPKRDSYTYDVSVIVCLFRKWK